MILWNKFVPSGYYVSPLQTSTPFANTDIPILYLMNCRCYVLPTLQLLLLPGLLLVMSLCCLHSLHKHWSSRIWNRCRLHLWGFKYCFLVATMSFFYFIQVCNWKHQFSSPLLSVLWFGWRMSCTNATVGLILEAKLGRGVRAIVWYSTDPVFLENSTMRRGGSNPSSQLCFSWLLVGCALYL